MYLNANNLYGGAMSEKLLTHEFKWVEDLNSIDVIGYKDGEDGYVLEVDVKYPAKLRWCHNTLPFLPEKMILGEVEKLVMFLIKTSM